MSEWPFVLSNNAAGFPNVFVGSSRPWNILIGSIHGRVFYGELRQSAYTTIADSLARRFTSGAIGSFSPRFIPGLELGAARIFEYAWPTGGLGWGDLRKPWEPFLKKNIRGDPSVSN
jgi:hypothetical protein